MKFFRYVKVKDKLVMLMIICVLSNIFLSVFSVDYLRKMSWHASDSYEQGLVPMDWVNTIEKNQRQLDNLLLNQGNEQKLTDASLEITESLDKLAALSIDKKINHQVKQLRTSYKELEEGGLNESQYTTISEGNQKIIENMQSYIVERNGEKQRAYEKDIQFGYILLGVVSLFCVMLILIIGFIATRAVNVPARQLKSLLKRAEQGDFTGNATYSAQDELGEVMLSYNQMVTEVKSLLLTVTQSTQDVEGMTDKLQKASSQTTTATVKIAQDIQGISNATAISTEKLASNKTSLNEVLEGMQVVLEKAQLVEVFAMGTVRNAEDGAQIVDGSIVQMKQISSAVEKSNKAILSLVESATSIEQFIGGIEKIAAQTNLLALNASIEAARAGENGKGFAIVANEVRKLAEQTVQSTSAITSLVQNIQLDSSNAVQMMDHVMLATNKGVDVTGQTASSFKDIVSKVHTMKPYIEEVSTTVKKIASYTEKVNEDASVLTSFSADNAKSTIHVADLTEEQLISNEQVTNYIREMKKVSKVLHSAVNRFSI
ncbi:MAG: methyl-accepting chemotaxis protein [Lysinibacillus sp.]